MYVEFQYLKARERQRTLHFGMNPDPKTLNHQVVRSAYEKVVEDLSSHKEPGAYPSFFWGSLHLHDREIRFDFLTDDSVTSEEEIDAVLDRQIARLKKAYGYNFQGIADLLVKHLEVEMQNHKKNETLYGILKVWSSLDHPTLDVFDSMMGRAYKEISIPSRPTLDLFDSMLADMDLTEEDQKALRVRAKLYLGG